MSLVQVTLPDIEVIAKDRVRTILYAISGMRMLSYTSLQSKQRLGSHHCYRYCQFDRIRLPIRNAAKVRILHFFLILVDFSNNFFWMKSTMFNTNTSTCSYVSIVQVHTVNIVQYYYMWIYLYWPTYRTDAVD